MLTTADKLYTRLFQVTANFSLQKEVAGNFCHQECDLPKPQPESKIFTLKFEHYPRAFCAMNTTSNRQMSSKQAKEQGSIQKHLK